jgi:1,4-dihydroxy-6-naphthoate synthase
LLNSGGALGKGVGPLLISDSGFPISDLTEAKVAIPGENTNRTFIVFIGLSKCQEQSIHGVP